MSLIKEIVNSLKPKDPVVEALAAVDATYLDDEQIAQLADYMNEMIKGAAKRGQELEPMQAALMALEDVAGFESAPQKVWKATAEKLIKSYNRQFFGK